MIAPDDIGTNIFGSENISLDNHLLPHATTEVQQIPVKFSLVIESMWTEDADISIYCRAHWCS